MEFRCNRTQNERGHNRPEVIACPAKADDNKELPLIGAHANTLDGSVEGGGVEPVVVEFVMIIRHFDSRRGFEVFEEIGDDSKKEEEEEER